MGSGFAKKKKQAKELQERLFQMQAEMETTEVEGSAGNGLVKIVLNGNSELKSISIHPDCVDREDVEGLELLIKKAFEHAANQLKEKGSPGGIPGLPPGFGF